MGVLFPRPRTFAKELEVGKPVFPNVAHRATYAPPPSSLRHLKLSTTILYYPHSQGFGKARLILWVSKYAICHSTRTCRTMESNASTDNRLEPLIREVQTLKALNHQLNNNLENLKLKVCFFVGATVKQV